MSTVLCNKELIEIEKLVNSYFLRVLSETEVLQACEGDSLKLEVRSR